ncbi:uncharacterized protein EAE97_006382 [Botrytis byssoidea]|uniref:Uncharacterized protein n=1 Tax=Botrytis byssoidea TaxID=139641 RepID=A0A9P5IJ37_9HELO|nr:uncharacterized protein EAE97_006382 [Botrytis byssoidea]KAF7942928.1 hypothetical protein EAE97_006382 [Botrytis byssoidea]
MNAEVQYFQHLAQSAGTDSRGRRYPEGSTIINSEEYQQVPYPTSPNRRRPTPEYTDWSFLSEWERSTQPKKKFPDSQHKISENLVSNLQKPIPECDTHPQAQDESHKTTQEMKQPQQPRKDNRISQRYMIPASIVIGALMISIFSHSFFSAAENFIKNVLEAFLIPFVFHPDQLCALIEILYGYFKCLENFPQFY